MKRTRLKNKANRTKCEEDLQKYRKQRNLVVKLNKRVKRAYYNNLDPSRVGKGDTLWKTFKPLFLDKEGNRKIILVGNGEILSDDKRISECFNEYFINITDTLNIVAHDIVIDINTSEDPVLNAISKYAQHPSILPMREHVASRENFEFTPADSLGVLTEINALNTGKKSSGPVPASMLKCASGVCLEEIT